MTVDAIIDVDDKTCLPHQTVCLVNYLRGRHECALEG